MCVQRPALHQHGMQCTEANAVSLVMSNCINWPCAVCPWQLHAAPGAVPAWHAVTSGQGVQLSHASSCIDRYMRLCAASCAAPAGIVAIGLHGPWQCICSSMHCVCRGGCHTARQARNMAAIYSEEITMATGFTHYMTWQHLAKPCTPGHSAQPCIWAQSYDPPAGPGWLPVPAAAAWSLPDPTGHHAACPA